MKVRVLVVEDNRDLAENIQELFEETGAQVTLCPRAEDVQRHLDRETFDLAIVDVRLPDNVSGVDLVPILRKAAPDGEVILATGSASLGTAIEAVRHGVFAYLQKPFDAHALLTLGERALAQVALRRERAALAAELARSEALHRAVVETVDSLILGLDAEHRVRMWNRCAVETTGWSADEVMGREACSFLLEPEERGAFERAVSAAMVGRGVDVMVRIRTKPGEGRIVRWRITPLAPAGNVRLVLAAGSDVTEKLELEGRAAEAEALAVMGRLTAGLAHEVRNPLNAAKLQLEIISRTARRMEASEARTAIHSRVEIVDAELGRLSRLLDEFLGLARPQHLAMGPVDVGAVVREVVELQAPVAENAGVELRAVVHEARPARGDAAKLKQALMNLVVNALEALGSTGRGVIEIVARQAGERWVEVVVTDTGPGLPQAPKELLQPFVTTKAAGTGLGLTIVNRIVELHGGTMEIGSRTGEGTAVRIQLPVAEG